ncbi:MAG: glycosyltransferase family 4 protein [Patescibacteria group bacterium]
MKKPRVLIFSLAYFPLVGGAEIAVKEITDRLASPTSVSPDVTSGELGAPTHSGVGVDFDLVTLRFNKKHLPKEKIGNINVFRVDGNKLLFPINSFLLARKLHKEKQYKIVWSIMAAYAGFGVLFFKILNPKVKFLLTLQEGDSEKHILKRVGIFYPLWKYIFKKADYIQVISNYLADFAKKYGAKCPIEVVPNGVNLDKFKTPYFAKATQGKQNSNTKTIITTSRLVYKNGVDILIRSMAMLKAKSPDSKAIEDPRQGRDYKLIIVGDGPDRSKLEQLTKDLSVDDIVQFVGHVDPNEIPNYLYKADVFVRASRSEGLGNSFLEAMAAGLPVIGTSVGGIVDFLKDGETGFLVEPENIESLTNKIDWVLSNQDISKEVALNGKNLIFKNYSWDGISEKIGKIFKKNIVNIRLLLATGIYPPDIGGPATYAKLLVDELPKRGVSIDVVFYGDKGVSRSIPKGIRHIVFFFKCFFKAIKSDVVLVQDTISAGLPALLASRLARRRFLIRVPGDYVWEQSVQRFGVKDSIDDFQNKKYGFKVEFLRSIQKFVVSNADVVITPSNYFKDLVKTWVKDKNKVITIYNGIDIATSDKRQATRNSKTIVSVGRLVPWKGFDMVIEMMIDLPDWKLVIIGDGPEYNNLKSQISLLRPPSAQGYDVAQQGSEGQANYPSIKLGAGKLQDRVILTGAILREKVLEYLANSEVFVLNTSFESFSYQIVEAMAMGIPVVTTNIGNISEIVRDGIDGVLVEPNDKDGYINVIKKINNNFEFRNSLIKSAIERSKDFSIERTLNSLVLVLKR